MHSAPTLGKDRAITPDQLLAAFRPAGEMPPLNILSAFLLWLRTLEHNCKAIIRFCQVELEKLRRQDDEELHRTLWETKRLATEALLITQKAIHSKNFRDARRLKLLRGKYDKVGGSVGHIFLLVAPHLAKRAEGNW